MLRIPMSCEESDWRAEDDLRTLLHAGEVENDPARLEKVKELAQKHVQKLESIFEYTTTKSTKTFTQGYTKL